MMCFVRKQQSTAIEKLQIFSADDHTKEFPSKHESIFISFYF